MSITKLSLMAVAAIAFSSACMAQPVSAVTVALSSPTASACTSNVDSVSDGFTMPLSNGPTGALTGKAILSPVSIVKKLDQCSARYVMDLFLGPKNNSVIITFSSMTATSSNTAILQITLTNAIIGSVTNSNSLGSPVSETVTISYETIKISDLSAGTSFTCSTTSNSCS